MTLKSPTVLLLLVLAIWPISSSVPETLEQSVCLKANGPNLKILLLQDVSVPTGKGDSPSKVAIEAQDQFVAQIGLSYAALQNIPRAEVALATFTDRAYVGSRSHQNGDHCFRLVEEFRPAQLPFNQSLVRAKASPVVTSEMLGGHLDALYTSSRLKSWTKDHSAQDLKAALRGGEVVPIAPHGMAKTPLRIVVLFTANGYRTHGHIDEVLNLDERRDFPPGCALNDYPTMALLRRAFDKFDIEPVIVTRRALVKDYEQVVASLERGSVVRSHVDRKGSSQKPSIDLHELLVEDILSAVNDICEARVLAPRSPFALQSADGSNGTKKVVLSSPNSNSCMDDCGKIKDGNAYRECVEKCSKSDGDLAVRAINAGRAPGLSVPRLRGGPGKTVNGKRLPTRITITV